MARRQLGSDVGEYFSSLLDVHQDDLDKIAERLIAKDVTPNHGRPVKTFSEALFLREPMIQRDRKEFALRLICWDDYKKLSLSTKADDLFVIGYGDAAGAALKDVNLEILEAEKFDEIKYILGISNAY